MTTSSTQASTLRSLETAPVKRYVVAGAKVAVMGTNAEYGPRPIQLNPSENFTSTMSRWVPGAMVTVWSKGVFQWRLVRSPSTSASRYPWKGPMRLGFSHVALTVAESGDMEGEYVAHPANATTSIALHNLSGDFMMVEAEWIVLGARTSIGQLLRNECELVPHSLGLPLLGAVGAIYNPSGERARRALEALRK